MAIIWGGEAHGQPVCVRLLQGQRRVRPSLRDPEKDVFQDAATLTGEVYERHQRHRPPPLAVRVQPQAGRPHPGLHRRGRLPARARRPQKLEQFQDDAGFSPAWEQIKAENKALLPPWVAVRAAFCSNTDAMFDVQVKRLHEYKRQLLNVLHIIYLYQRLKADPHFDFTPAPPFRGQGRPGYAGGQADHPPHQLPGRHVNRQIRPAKTGCRWCSWRTTG